MNRRCFVAAIVGLTAVTASSFVAEAPTAPRRDKKMAGKSLLWTGPVVLHRRIGF